MYFHLSVNSRQFDLGQTATKFEIFSVSPVSGDDLKPDIIEIWSPIQNLSTSRKTSTQVDVHLIQRIIALTARY